MMSLLICTISVQISENRIRHDMPHVREIPMLINNFFGLVQEGGILFFVKFYLKLANCLTFIIENQI